MAVATEQVARQRRGPTGGSAGRSPRRRCWTRLGARFHDGDALRRSARPAADDHRWRQSWGIG